LLLRGVLLELTLHPSRSLLLKIFILSNLLIDLNEASFYLFELLNHHFLHILYLFFFLLKQLVKLLEIPFHRSFSLLDLTHQLISHLLELVQMDLIL